MNITSFSKFVLSISCDKNSPLADLTNQKRRGPETSTSIPSRFWCSPTIIASGSVFALVSSYLHCFLRYLKLAGKRHGWSWLVMAGNSLSRHLLMRFTGTLQLYPIISNVSFHIIFIFFSQFTYLAPQWAINCISEVPKLECGSS